MAFGIKREELALWKTKISRGEIAFLTHYWKDDTFPGSVTVTKVGCVSVGKLAQWGSKYGLKKEWIHYRDSYPHYDLFGERQKEILSKEGLQDHIIRFRLF